MNWKKTIRYLILTTMIAVSCLVILPYYQFSFFIFNKYAIQIMLFFMVLSVLFLIKSEQLLLFSALFCAGAIALYLKENTVSRIQMAPEKMPYSFSVAVVQLEHVPLEKEKKLRKLLFNRNADIALINQLTPAWLAYLKKPSQAQYSHWVWNERTDDLGKGLISRYPLKSSLKHAGGHQPLYNYQIDFPFLKRKVEMISRNFKEPTNTRELKELREQLNALINSMPSERDLPLMITGDFDLVSWNPVLSQFKKENHLLDSRRNFLALQRNKRRLFQIRISKDNLLYSDELECSAFEDIYLDNVLIGFIADYQLSER